MEYDRSCSLVPLLSAHSFRHRLPHLHLSVGHPGAICAVAAHLNSLNFVEDEHGILTVVIPGVQQ